MSEGGLIGLFCCALFAIIVVITDLAVTNPTLRAKVRPSFLSPDQDQIDAFELSEHHRELLRQHHEEFLAAHSAAKHHHRPQRNAAHNPPLPLSKATIKRIASVAAASEPLYHGQIFREPLLPTAHNALYSVNRIVAAALGASGTTRSSTVKSSNNKSKFNVAVHLMDLFQRSLRSSEIDAGIVVPVIILSFHRRRCVPGSLRQALRDLDVAFRHLVVVVSSRREEHARGVDNRAQGESDTNDDDDDDDDDMSVLLELQSLTGIGAVTILEATTADLSLGEVVNLGIRRGREILKARSELSFIREPYKSIAVGTDAAPDESHWYLYIDACAAVFSNGSLATLAKSLNNRIRYDRMATKMVASHESVGIFFPFSITPAAFAIRDVASEKVGYFNEALYSSYELTDYMWRLHQTNFRSMRNTNAMFAVQESSSDTSSRRRRRRRVSSSTNKNLSDNGNADDDDNGDDDDDRIERMKEAAGLELLWQLWGPTANVVSALTLVNTYEVPPSNRGPHPFSIEFLPAHMWAIDPVHRRCINSRSLKEQRRDGEKRAKTMTTSSDDDFPRFLSDIGGGGLRDGGTCWYNFSNTHMLRFLKKERDIVHAQHPKKKSQQEDDSNPLPVFLRRPTVSMRVYEDAEYGYVNPDGGFLTFLIFFGVIGIVLAVTLGVLLWKEDVKKSR